MEKEFLIYKICDQKEREYNFIRILETDEVGFPLDSELDKFIDIENGKNVAILSELDKIRLICFEKKSKFRKIFLKEYKKLLEKDVQYKIYSNDIELCNELNNSEVSRNEKIK